MSRNQYRSFFNKKVPTCVPASAERNVVAIKGEKLKHTSVEIDGGSFAPEECHEIHTAADYYQVVLGTDLDWFAAGVRVGPKVHNTGAILPPNINCPTTLAEAKTGPLFPLRGVRELGDSWRGRRGRSGGNRCRSGDMAFATGGQENGQDKQDGEKFFKHNNPPLDYLGLGVVSETIEAFRFQPPTFCFP